MTNKLISLSVPADDKDAIQAAATMFNYLVTLKGGFDKLPEGAKQTAVAAQAQPPKAEDLTVNVASVEAGDSGTATEQPSSVPTASAQSTESTGADDDNTEWPQRVNGVLLDSQGLPWDARVDSSNQKCRKADGVWTPKRGVDKDLYEKVKAELRAAMKGEKPAEQYNAGQAFGSSQQAPAEQPAVTQAAPQCTSVPEYYKQIMAYPAKLQDPVAKAFGWGSLSLACGVAANDPHIFDKVLAALKQEASK